jgi:hypothetical protein
MKIFALQKNNEGSEAILIDPYFKNNPCPDERTDTLQKNNAGSEETLIDTYFSNNILSS